MEKWVEYYYAENSVTILKPLSDIQWVACKPLDGRKWFILKFKDTLLGYRFPNDNMYQPNGAYNEFIKFLCDKDETVFHVYGECLGE